MGHQSRCRTFAVEEQIDGGDYIRACQSFYSLLLLRLEITNSFIISHRYCCQRPLKAKYVQWLVDIPSCLRKPR